MGKEKLEKRIDHIIREYATAEAVQEICRMIRQLQLNAYKEGTQKRQLKAFVDWWHNLSQEELVWYEGRYVEVFLSL